MTNAELAERVGLSPSPCLRRVRQLEASGLIKGYVALLDPERIGLSVSAFVRARLDRQDDQHLAMFEEAIQALPQVMECYLMTGDVDYSIRVATASAADYEDLHTNILSRLPGVARIQSSIAMRNVLKGERRPKRGPAS